MPELVLTESVIEQLFSTPYDSELRRGLVYKLTNRETGLAYVGMTGSSIEERLKGFYPFALKALKPHVTSETSIRR